MSSPNDDYLQYLDCIGEQHITRKKYERIRCPACNATSKVVLEGSQGWQDRICKNGHYFHYSYEVEAVWQGLNYKCR